MMLLPMMAIADAVKIDGIYYYLMEDAKKALETDDLDKIKEAKDKLSEKAMALSSRVYEEINKANQEAQNNKEEEKEDKKSKKDSKVKEAEYEEK